MNKKQKELIAQCKPYPLGTPFDCLYIIPSGKLYNGFWGKNGYNKIYLVCQVQIKDKDDEYYLIGDKYEIDVVSLPNIEFDIPKELNCVRCFVGSGKRFVINTILSSLDVEIMNY